MSLWRLEWLRLIRTKRWIALLGIYVFAGFLGPFTARYLSEIISFAGGDLEGVTVEFPPPVPADGLTQFVSNATQIGTLVAVVVAAGALAFDAIPEMGVFLRTRVVHIAKILAPRFVVAAGAIVTSFTIGALVAWYETWALIGAPDTSSVLAGIGFAAVYLVFVVAIVAAAAGLTSSILGTVIVSIVALLVMPILGLIDALARWLPTHLANALAILPTGERTASDYAPATAVAIVATVALLWAALRSAHAREL